MSWPALQALQEAKRPLVPSTGDQLNGYTKFLVANKVRGYAYPMTTKLSGEAVKQALEAVKGEKVEKKVVLTIPGYGPDKIQTAEQARPVRLVVDRRRPDARRVPAQA